MHTHPPAGVVKVGNAGGTLMPSSNGRTGIGTDDVAGSAGRILMIPKYAEGGIVNKPHIGMVGEAGPEAIIPLSKLSGFLNHAKPSYKFGIGFTIA